jgi:DNA (cytosine-5)-methyltransferase 1
MRATAWAVVACAEVTRPRLLVVENVQQYTKWLLYPDWCSALKRLGYHLTELNVMASDHGVPQRRPRVFIVGTRRAARVQLQRQFEVPFGPCLDPDADGWRPVAEAADGARARFAKARARLGPVFLSQHVTGHPGVPLSEPIRTITTAPKHWCLVEGDRYRYLTDRELARGQSFPDSFTWPANLPHEAVIEGIGNAVPPLLGEAVLRGALAAA